MSSAEIISLIVTIIGVFSFATIFTILYQSYATSQINEIQSGKKDLELIDEVIYERQEKIKKRKMVTKIVKSPLYTSQRDLFLEKKLGADYMNCTDSLTNPCNPCNLRPNIEKYRKPSAPS